MVGVGSGGCMLRKEWGILDTKSEGVFVLAVVVTESLSEFQFNAAA